MPIFLPGNMCDARLWRGDSDILLATLLRRGLPDPHDADLTQDASIAGMAARTLAAVQGRILPIGFSMGAIVAIEMWFQAPQRVAGIVLLGYNATADLPERAAHRPAQQAEVIAGGLERVLVEELKPNYLAARHRSNAPLLALLRDMGLALGADVFVRQSEALRLRADRRDVLAHVTAPVLIGCGEEDKLCPPAWHANWANLLPDADAFTVAGAGHMLPLEAPRTLAGHLDRWLAATAIA